MYKEVASGIHNVGVYPAISFVVFFVFFLAIAVWLVRSKRSDFDEVSNMPMTENKG